MAGAQEIGAVVIGITGESFSRSQGIQGPWAALATLWGLHLMLSTLQVMRRSTKRQQAPAHPLRAPQPQASPLHSRDKRESSFFRGWRQREMTGSGDLSALPASRLQGAGQSLLPHGPRPRPLCRLSNTGQETRWTSWPLLKQHQLM